MKKTVEKIKWLYEKLNKAFTVLLKVAGVVIAITVIFGIYGQVVDNSVVIRRFIIPKNLEANGIIEEQFILNVIDEVNKTSKEWVDRPEFNNYAEIKPQKEYVVGGIRISPTAVSDYIREVLGRERKEISGELVYINDTLLVKLRENGRLQHEMSLAFRKDSNNTSQLQAIYSGISENILRQLAPLGLAYYFVEKKNDLPKAQEVIEEFMREYSNKREYCFELLSMIKMRELNHADALKYINKAIAINPCIDRFWLSYVDNWKMYSSVKNVPFDEAPVLKSLYKKYRNQQLLVKIANYYYEEKSYDSAAHYYQQLLKNDRRNLTYLKTIAECNLKTKKYRNAIEYAERALKIEKEYGMYETMADAYYALGKKEMFLKQLQLAQAYRPDTPNNLAARYSRYQNDPAFIKIINYDFFNTQY